MTNAPEANAESIEAVVKTLLGDKFLGLFPREKAESQLGKRYICGQAYQTQSEGGDEKRDVGYLSGTHKGINFGCGTIILCTKSSTGESGSPYCCDMPMTLQKPRLLPSSD